MLRCFRAAISAVVQGIPPTSMRSGLPLGPRRALGQVPPRLGEPTRHVRAHSRLSQRGRIFGCVAKSFCSGTPADSGNTTYATDAAKRWRLHDVNGCMLCGRKVQLTFHHLIPKKMHRKPRFKRIYTKDEMETGIKVCRLCHKGIHRRYDEMELAARLNTREALLNDPELARHFAWVAKQKAGGDAAECSQH